MGNIVVEKYGDRLICIKGVGTLFHESGFPIGMAAKELYKQNIELSWFHVIKELYYQYTSNDRLYGKIKAEVEDAKIDGISVDLEELKTFIYADYPTKQEMIFKYLFNNDIDLAKDFYYKKVMGGNEIQVT